MGDLNNIKRTGAELGSMIELISRISGSRVFNIPSEFVIISGTPALGVVGSQIGSTLYDGEATEAMGTCFPMPADMDVTKAATVRLSWSSANTAGTNVYWRITTAGIGAEAVTAALTTVNVVAADSAIASYRNETTFAIAVNVYASTDKIILLNLSRMGGEATDTLNSVDASAYTLGFEYSTLPYIQSEL